MKVVQGSKSLPTHCTNNLSIEMKPGGKLLLECIYITKVAVVHKTDTNR